jgi:hypothetical protein
MTERLTEPLFWGVETGQCRLTHEALDEYLQSYLRYITESCQKLDHAATPFSTYERSIPPEQIKGVRHSLKEMLKPTIELNRLLHDTDHLPVIYTALSYSLLAVVNIIENQISRVLDLLYTYQVAGTSPSEDEKWLREEVHSMCERLLHFTMTLPERVKLIQDEAVKQESRLLSLYENY